MTSLWCSSVWQHGCYRLGVVNSYISSSQMHIFWDNLELCWRTIASLLLFDGYVQDQCSTLLICSVGIRKAEVSSCIQFVHLRSSFEIKKTESFTWGWDSELNNISSRNTTVWWHDQHLFLIRWYRVYKFCSWVRIRPCLPFQNVMYLLCLLLPRAVMVFAFSLAGLCSVSFGDYAVSYVEGPKLICMHSWYTGTACCCDFYSSGWVQIPSATNQEALRVGGGA